ncbi:hypothetical protein [Streptomyces sp. NPDC058335]|uniref:hypothetical protein n=1 Tax=Streptomyces sp. NPDC058335 TaxID=3346451 RepID=UPI0036526D40
MAASAEDVDRDDGQNGQLTVNDAEVPGHAAVAAAKVLDREGLDRDGSHILDDTVAAVGDDTGAESHAGPTAVMRNSRR